MQHRRSPRSRFFSLLLAILVFRCCCYADDPLLIYVCGQPFEGQYHVVGQDIYLESDAFRKALGAQAQAEFPLKAKQEFSGKTFVSLSAYAKMSRGFLSSNWDTRIVDFYFPKAGVQAASTQPSVGAPTEILPGDRPNGVSLLSNAQSSPFPDVPLEGINVFRYDPNNYCSDNSNLNLNAGCTLNPAGLILVYR